MRACAGAENSTEDTQRERGFALADYDGHILHRFCHGGRSI